MHTIMWFAINFLFTEIVTTLLLEGPLVLSEGVLYVIAKEMEQGVGRQEEDWELQVEMKESIGSTKMFIINPVQFFKLLRLSQ